MLQDQPGIALLLAFNFLLGIISSLLYLHTYLPGAKTKGEALSHLFKAAIGAVFFFPIFILYMGVISIECCKDGIKWFKSLPDKKDVK